MRRHRDRSIIPRRSLTHSAPPVIASREGQALGSSSFQPVQNFAARLKFSLPERTYILARVRCPRHALVHADLA